ncbi:Cell-cycle control medial ring component [Penicillium ucsense]|uniref:Cell-cycle control medial ring component n=1 Tax=Penicillium ucsense TaxID=2839758 RepID=A0A8J8W4V6_9EURO|nr:Cell-cycle control medial ring component [Penicillium ucsense]KAF7735420.1 Cell-cycle control medial ring component [Penicillium ucsense]
MSELAFAKSFLASLDSRPIKLRADHVFDPEQVGLRVPYTLPRFQPPHPEMPKKTQQAQAPGSSKSVSIKVKSARNPTLDFSISNAPISTTTIQDLKDAVRQRVSDAHGNSVALDKIKILYRRKPVPGSGKTVAEVLADEPDTLAGGKEVEFGTMIIGGAKTLDAVEPSSEVIAEQDIPKPAVGPSGVEILKTDEFWDDLRGFLEQRLKDSDEAKHLAVLFKGAWRSE